MEVSPQDAAMVLEGAKLMRETQTEELIEKYRSGLRTASGQEQPVARYKCMPQSSHCRERKGCGAAKT